MLRVSSISSHKKQVINEASILRLQPHVIEEIGDDESFYLYQKCQSVLYYSMTKNQCNEVALVYALGTHEEGNYIKGTQQNTDIESDVKTHDLLNRPDGKVCILLHNHPTEYSFSIEDYAEFILYAKIRVMVAVTNIGNQFFMVKTEKYNRRLAVAKLMEITTRCDHDDDGILTRAESVQAANEFERIAYMCGIRIE